MKNNLNLHPDLVEFVTSLLVLVALLQEAGEEFWSAKISRTRAIAENSDGHCVRKFLSFYGGMGSFNDLVLNASSATNSFLDSERRYAYELAQKLR